MDCYCTQGFGPKLQICGKVQSYGRSNNSVGRREHVRAPFRQQLEISLVAAQKYSRRLLRIIRDLFSLANAQESKRQSICESCGVVTETVSSKNGVSYDGGVGFAEVNLVSVCIE